jgi:hypothetical protein
MPEIGVDIAQKSVGRDFVDSNQGLRPRLAESRAEPMDTSGTQRAFPVLPSV